MAASGRHVLGHQLWIVLLLLPSFLLLRLLLLIFLFLLLLIFLLLLPQERHAMNSSHGTPGVVSGG